MNQCNHFSVQLFTDEDSFHTFQDFPKDSLQGCDENNASSSLILIFILVVTSLRTILLAKFDDLSKPRTSGVSLVSQEHIK